MQFWWVNQNQTYKQEFEGGYLWSPKVARNGARIEFYENMTKIEPGDIIFSFRNAKIVSVGIALTRAYSYLKPSNFGKVGDVWADDGWCVEVEYHKVSNAIRPASLMEKLGPLLPKKYSPLQPTGRGNQAYLFAVPESMALFLVSAIGYEAEDVVFNIVKRELSQIADLEQEASVIENSKISKTEKNQIIRSRVGQGLFRSRLEEVESRCRITLVRYKSHLIASHIKPWSKSDNYERLDGNNGLLLAPHIDHLFDRGYISFMNNGDLISSNQLRSDVLPSWFVSKSNVGKFNSEQKIYLEYHRDLIFKADT